MLKLLLGDFGTGKTTHICREIEALLKSSTPSFLIVPEGATVATERTLAGLLPPSAPLFFEVTNFSRLANTIFRRAGGLSCHPLGKDGRAFLMWQALRACRERLSVEVNDKLPENVLRFVSAVDELRAAGIRPDELQAVLPTLNTHKLLRTKIGDYLEIAAAYHALAEEKEQSAPGDDLTRLADLLEAEPLLQGTPLFFDGFVSLTAQEMRIIRALLPMTDITVSLTVKPTSEPPIAYAEVVDTARRVKALAEELHVPVRIASLKDAHRPAHPVFHHIADSLFSSNEPVPFEARMREQYGTDIAIPQDAPIQIKEADTVFDEANLIAAEICRLIQNGARYRDILLIGRNPEGYRGILDEALRRNGIPCFFSERTDLATYEPIKLIFAAYSMRASHFRAADVITYLKCGFSGIDRDCCDELEIYITTWNLRGTHFTDSRPFNLHPRGYTSREQKASEKALLERLNLAKEALTRPFEAFGGSPCKRTVKEHATALVLFLERLQVESTLEGYAQAAASNGKRTNATIYRALYPCICRTLDRIVHLLAEAVVDEADFVALLTLAFACTDIGSIPSGADEVVIGDASMLRPASPKHTFIFGANDGIFPGAAEDSGFFNRAERRLLNQAGLDFPEEAYFSSARERYAFLRAFLSPTESLTITVPLAGSGLAALRPAPVLDEIQKLGGRFVSVFSAKDASLDTLLFRRESALDLMRYAKTEEEKLLIRKLISEDTQLKERAKILDIPLVMPECHIREREANGAPLALTQSRLDSFARCPFSYTCRYVLGLNENSEADFRYAESGTFVHALLEQIFRQLAEEGRTINSLSDSERTALLERISLDYEAALIPDERAASKRLTHMCRRLTSSTLPVLDSLCREFADSDFVPRFFELPIGTKGGIQPPPILLADGTKLTLYGTIDRVDSCRIDGKAYLRVIDYKTGTKTFSPDNIAKGLDLQLLLYLHALVESGSDKFRDRAGFLRDEPIYPAGMFYLLTGQKDIKLDSREDTDAIRMRAARSITRSGILLCEDNVIGAMAHEDARTLFGYRIQKGIPVAQAGITLATPEDINRYFSMMKDSLRHLGERICKGEAHALPLRAGNARSDACTHCAFKPVCRNAVTVKEESSE